MSKPIHNRVMCPECFKQKMLFETQKKADDFIKWNGEDIDTHGGELRSYYCPACGGWHISSKPYKESYAHNTENLIKRYENALEYEKKKVHKLNKSEKREEEIRKLISKFKKEIPKTMEYTKSWLRDLLDAWIEKEKIELENGLIGEIRHELYKDYML